MILQGRLQFAYGLLHHAQSINYGLAACWHHDGLDFI